MKKRLAIAALLMLVAAGEPPAASDVVWETKRMPSPPPYASGTDIIYEVPAGRGFLLREVDGDGAVVTIHRVRENQKELVADKVGMDSTWKPEVGIPFQPRDKVQITAPRAGQLIRISGVLTKP